MSGHMMSTSCSMALCPLSDPSEAVRVRCLMGKDVARPKGLLMAWYVLPGTALIKRNTWWPEGSTEP